METFVMHVKSIIQVCAIGFLIAAPAFGAPTNTGATSVKTFVHSKVTKTQKTIKHPVLLRVKKARIHAQSKTKATAKQFDLSGALRAAK